VIQPFTAAIAKVSAVALQIFDSTVQADGIVLRNIQTGAAVSIQPGCNGVEARYRMWFSIPIRRKVRLSAKLARVDVLPRFSSVGRVWPLLPGQRRLRF
jgi:hypothetical protein